MYNLPNRMQVLYNKDCVSDQAIIYWYQKGSKPQGRQHFLKVTEALVKVCPPILFYHFSQQTYYILFQFLQDQEDSDEEEEE
jgi:hypothetical protein